MTYESLQRSLQADRLCLLNRHLPLPLRTPHSSPQPQGLKAREAEAWEEPVSLLGLPGTLVGMQDPRLEGALHLLLAQQLRAQRAASARLRGPATPEETPPSPPVGLDSEIPESEVPGAALAPADLPGGWQVEPTGPVSPQSKEVTATQDYAPDKPLDLSDRGRDRDAPKSTGQPGPFSPAVAHTPSPEPPTLSGPLICSPQALSNGTKETRAPEPKESPTPMVRGPTLAKAQPLSLSPRSLLKHPHCLAALFPPHAKAVPRSSLAASLILKKEGLASSHSPGVPRAVSRAECGQGSPQTLKPFTCLPRTLHTLPQGPTPACPLLAGQEVRPQEGHSQHPTHRGLIPTKPQVQ